LGYDQYVALRIRKDGADAETLHIALNLSFPEFFRNVDEWGSHVEKRKDGTISITINGKAPLYEEGGILFEGEVNLQKVSRELECTVDIYYEGEEKMDGEMVTYENGIKTEHKVLGWVDAP
jgi:hypothetical protein